jgi:hypothetical protein
MRRSEDKHAIAAILAMTASPPDARLTEGPLHCAPQAIAHRDLVATRPPQIPEPLDIHNDKGPVNRWTRIRHFTSRRR